MQSRIFVSRRSDPMSQVVIVQASLRPNRLADRTNGWIRHGDCKSNNATFRPSTIQMLGPTGCLTLLARGVSDDEFREMVALPLAIPQSQRGVGTSGTPIFLRAG